MRTFVHGHAQLPVFRAQSATDTWFYTPGTMTHMAGTHTDAPAAVLDLARQAEAKWHTKHSLPFEPTCLTLYLSNRCNISCSYCYSAFGAQRRVPHRAPPSPELPLLSEAAVRAAARLVAANCEGAGKPLSLVVHGGGEPTATFTALRRAVEITREQAAGHGIDWTGYVSTNGVMPRATAAWLGDTFARIGLSCDGPPHVQDRDRRTAAGGPTSRHLERTARILARHDARVGVRTTVLPETLQHLRDAVVYAVETLGAASMHVEPAYGPGTGWQRSSAGAFVDAFLDAAETGRNLGIAINLSGVRLDELHGPHCTVSKDVLSITPDGAVTACFLTTDGRLERFGDYIAGRYDAATDTYRFDEARLRRMLELAAAIPDGCRGCFNVMHCARDCPDRCSLKDEAASGGFRCEVNRRLAQHWLDELAQRSANGGFAA